jgi:predicted Zn-dependent protease
MEHTLKYTFLKRNNFLHLFLSKKRKNMNKNMIVLVCLVILGLSCTRVPISNRRQLHLLPENQLILMSEDSYRQFLKANKVVPKTDTRAAMVEKVGKKIQAAVEEFMTSRAQSKRIKGFRWEYNLVDDRTINAWCMPGGKVVFYTGILDITQDEEGLAVVMGHEIAHAIARHGNERMSQQIAIQGGGLTLSVLTSQQPELTQTIFNQAYGVGSTLGSLAYSRKHETEADQLGLVFMAIAGYNPDAAPDFWRRMSSAGGGGVPELLSTHPSDATRISDIEKFLPEARKYYKK